MKDDKPEVVGVASRG